MEQKYFTGSMLLLTPENNFVTIGGHEAFTSTSIFIVVKLIDSAL